MEKIIRKYLKHGADQLKPFENVPNNSVYSFESGGESYIFKLFRSKYWPEDDKLQFVNETFDGSLPAFLAAFTAQSNLTAEEVSHLRAIIKKYEEE